MSQEGLGSGKEQGKCPSVRMSPSHLRNTRKAGVSRTKEGDRETQRRGFRFMQGPTQVGPEDRF